MKLKILLIIMSVLLLGCTSKHPSVKTGATIGGITGLIAGGLLGAGLSKTHPANGDAVGGAAIGAVVLGLIGLGLGAGTGYIVDSFSNNDDEMQEMIQSQNLEGMDR